MHSRLNNIQALRAFAALSVVLFHSGYIFGHLSQFGFYGVDIFFVISGYIMANICDKRPQNFLRRRLIRIVPLYWVATLGIFVLASVAPGLMHFTRPNVVELVKSLLFIPFAKENGLPQPLLFVGWSLNYEMYFYLLLWLGLLLAGRRAPFFAGGALVLVYSALNLYHPHGAFAQFYASDRPLEFLWGMAIYYGARKVPARWAWRWRWAMAGASLAAVAMLVVYFSALLRWYPPNWIGFGLLSSILVASAVLWARAGADIQAGWVILLGDASYALYLLHAYIVYLQERVIARRFPLLSPQNRLFGLLISLVLVSVISCGVYLWVEKPFLDWFGRRYARNPRSPEPVLAQNPL